MAHFDLNSNPTRGNQQQTGSGNHLKIPICNTTVSAESTWNTKMDDISAPTQALLQLPVKPSTLFRSMCEGGGGCNIGNDDGNPD